ncbi:MAG: hypothetical protein KKD73_00535 [Proteobacteria bacterium]|nr:hypothetical protein [Pseudomonadota bacterium]MBU1640982.1 hypothetical protein [Pseudomonadota bacterium]
MTFLRAREAGPALATTTAFLPADTPPKASKSRHPLKTVVGDFFARYVA